MLRIYILEETFAAPVLGENKCLARSLSLSTAAARRCSSGGCALSADRSGAETRAGAFSGRIYMHSLH